MNIRHFLPCAGAGVWLFAWLLSAASAPGQARLAVAVNKPGHPVAPALWGIFFEDINHSADGGIYPELVRNRSFEDSNRPEWWQRGGEASSEASIDSGKPLNPFNRHSLRVDVRGSVMLRNDGYWGMNVARGERYAFKVAARTEGFPGALDVRLFSAAGIEYAHRQITGLTRDWRYFETELVSGGTDPRAHLELAAAGEGTFFLDMVSLMPLRTWKGHGLRIDLAEMIAALNPSFVRFPGGCWVEGEDLDHMYHWKNTVGAVDVRTPLYNIWGYWATHGLGLHEYLQLSEDLGAAPVFCINAGMSHRENVPLDRMDQWVQDALDAIEYANGPTNSLWGTARARNGHPAPFQMKYLQIGNENGGPPYYERWALFHHSIKSKYPDLQLIADAWDGYPKTPPPDIIDEHYYDTPEFFMRQANRYDRYDRAGPRVFVGEYAVTRNCGKGNLRGAIGEAAFMTGIERNSDLVIMACYAPLFVNLNHRRWNPDLINFDSSRAYGLPSYYVQKLFSENRGDVTLPVAANSPFLEAAPRNGAVGIGTWRTRAEFKDARVTAPDGRVLFTSDFSRNTGDWKFLGDGSWRLQDGVLRQETENESVRAIAGDKAWTDYTLTLKARKLGGNEGFLVLFRVNNEDDKCWWNLGGWGNTGHGIEFNDVVTRVPGSIESLRWYDIRVEVRGPAIRCYLDGKLIHDLEHRSIPALYASATLETKTGDVILKLVNASAEILDTDITLNGVTSLAGPAAAIVLTSANPADENSIDTPERVVPRRETFPVGSPEFRRSLPGNSVTVLRIGSRKQ